MTITLPVPTSYRVEPARLVAWLGANGYSECSEAWCSPCRLTFTKPRPAEPGRRYVIELPRDGVGSPMDHRGYLLDAITDAAEIEGMQAHALAALLAPPVEGPALQWAHASAAVREDTIATILDAAKSKRADASEEREGGQIKVALAFEAQAMGLEAAAAVLRASR